ncbi:C40 family peptidase [Paenibacillus taichungensis]|uniref:C40 family peptidase n=1 Tax=Paenibacillus taichungensis TaxID=484184 RepID=A0ABX2MLG8_9BACL|nr:C40 family peptidase [Paenibacillus taichungensis]NUU54870.1 C40 family peptidase [Paenibacillus taichungensis]
MNHSLKIFTYAKIFVGMQFKRNPLPLELDCSLFTQMVFAKFGIKLPRTSRDQAKKGFDVNKNDLRPGDLIFFHIPDRNPASGSVGHVAIYANKQKMVHCLPTSNVFLTDMNLPYWKNKYLFAKRILK